MSIEMTRPELDHHLRLMAALKMFELGQISSGKAAELAGMTRVDFFQTCSRYHVSIFNYSPDDAEREILSDLQAFDQALHHDLRLQRRRDRSMFENNNIR